MPLPFNDTEDNRSSLGVRHGGIGLPEAPWESALGRFELPILGFSELKGREEDIHIEFVHRASLGFVVIRKAQSSCASIDFLPRRSIAFTRNSASSPDSLLSPLGQGHCAAGGISSYIPLGPITYHPIGLFPHLYSSTRNYRTHTTICSGLTVPWKQSFPSSHMRITYLRHRRVHTSHLALTCFPGRHP